MSIRIIIVVEVARGEKIDAGGFELAGVHVHTEGFDLKAEPSSVGATWVGICTAINEYMRSRGAEDFDCLKQIAVEQ